MYPPRSRRGVTLLDTIVGISLMLVVFLGIYGVFQLSVDLVTNNKARTGALALAQERIEYIRSLSYEDAAVAGGIPAGELAQTEDISLNGIDYTRRTLIRYFDDPNDGSGDEDENNVLADSKEVKVSVAWNAPGGMRTLVLVTRLSPIGIESEVPGGVLSIVATDANAVPLAGAEVRIQNDTILPTVDVVSFTNEDGRTSFVGVPEASEYSITVTKAGYSTAQTYASSAENPDPQPRHLTVSEHQTTSATFAIDVLASNTVRTYQAVEESDWEDTFDDASKLSTTSEVVVLGGAVQLAGEDAYAASGSATSIDIAPVYLYGWKEVSWSDEQPEQTSIVYHILDATGALIPDIDLPGNSSGFIESPIDISALATTSYPAIRIRAVFATEDTALTPTLDQWEVHFDEGPVPLPDISFTMRGAKSIGTNGEGASILKYDETHSSGAGASVLLDELEWDIYTIFLDDASSEYDIAEACEPTPRSILPGADVVTELFLREHTANSLLVDVRSAATGELLPGVSVTLAQGSAFEEVQTSSACGQVFFHSLDAGTVSGGNPYTIQVSGEGYEVFTEAALEVAGTDAYSVQLLSL